MGVTCGSLTHLSTSNLTHRDQLQKCHHFANDKLMFLNVNFCILIWSSPKCFRKWLNLWQLGRFAVRSVSGDCEIVYVQFMKLCSLLVGYHISSLQSFYDLLAPNRSDGWNVWVTYTFIHVILNTSRSVQQGHRFVNDIFKWIFLNAKFCILIWSSLKYFPKRPNWLITDSGRKQLHQSECVGWNYLFNPKLQRHNNWSMGMLMYFHPTL